ncbi:SpoIID/LytB domain-containing protein [Elusimicrobiota bacterium]
MKKQIKISITYFFALPVLLSLLLVCHPPSWCADPAPEYFADVKESKDHGRILYARGQYADAASAFDYALTRFPSDAEAMVGLALSLEAQGKFIQATKHWENAVNKTYSKDYWIVFSLGRNYLSRGHLGTAIKVWKRLMPSLEKEKDANPSIDLMRTKTILFMALAQYLSGQYSDSLGNVEYLKKYLKKSLALLYEIGARAHLAMKDPAVAISEFKRTLKKDNTLAEVRKDLSVAYADYGEIDNAYLQMRRYLYAQEDAHIKEKFAGLTAKLSKSPHELLKAHESGFSLSWPKTVDWKLPNRSELMNVGLWADPDGIAQDISEVRIMSNSQFELVLGYEETILMGKTNETWRILFVSTPVAYAVVLRGEKEEIRTGRPFSFKTSDPASGSFLLKGARLVGMPHSEEKDFQVRGSLVVIPGGNGFVLINEVEIEAYLLGVIAAEIGPKSPLEAFKAQTVLARSYTLWRKNIDRYHQAHGHPYSICDTWHCQVYKGYVMENKSARTAIESTWGQVVKDVDSKITPPFYHASCGGLLNRGKSEISPWDLPKSDIMPGQLIDFTPRKLVKFFELSPLWDNGLEWCFENYSRFSWMRLVDFKDIIREASANYPKIGKCKAVFIKSRGFDGRVTSIELQGTRGSQIIDEDYPIRKALSLGSLRSSLFYMVPITKSNKWRFILFSGRGYGHGKGMCQVGAINQSKNGKNYKEILDFYYPDSQISKMY